MRDAAGDSGEFYTPGPLVRFIVKVVDPQLGETVLDPAAGTGGFLVQAFEHLRAQPKTTEDYSRLQRDTLSGILTKMKHQSRNVAPNQQHRFGGSLTLSMPKTCTSLLPSTIPKNGRRASRAG
jgi:type I restriction-modification system DNA methylase subunit